MKSMYAGRGVEDVALLSRPRSCVSQTFVRTVLAQELCILECASFLQMTACNLILKAAKARMGTMGFWKLLIGIVLTSHWAPPSAWLAGASTSSRSGRMATVLATALTP